MALTLADILDLDVLRRGEPEVVAGHGQLNRQVRWVHISEQADIANYLKGGEMLLMTGMGLSRAPAAQRRFIRELDEVGVVGVLIRLGAAFDELPAVLVEEAMRRDLPVVALHRRIGYMDVTEQVHGAIINRQVDLLRKAEQIRLEFTQLLLRGGSLPRILQRLGSITRCPIVMEDTAHQVTELEPQGRELADVLAAWESHSRIGHGETDGAVHVQEGNPPCAWVPVSLRGEEWGRLHALQLGRGLDDIDLLALDRAAAAVGLALLTEHDSRSTTDAAHGALISDILRERYRDTEELFRRARSIGVELAGRRLAALVVDLRGLAELAEREGFGEQLRQDIRERILRDVRAAVLASGSVSLSALDGDRVLAVIGCLDRPGIRDLLDDVGSEICDRIARSCQERIAPVVGVSDESATSGLRRALQHASDAAKFGSRTAFGAGVRHFGDLGVFELLLPLSEGPQLASYVEAELGPLLNHDSSAAVPLLPTLQCFLEHSGRISVTSSELHIQRRTLYHRLSRLTVLLGRDLENPDVRLRLWVALRGLDLLRRRSVPELQVN